ncbi:MAG: hypothetical protein ACRDQE_11945 [Gaiellales bacterium]
MRSSARATCFTFWRVVPRAAAAPESDGPDSASATLIKVACCVVRSSARSRSSIIVRSVCPTTRIRRNVRTRVASPSPSAAASASPSPIDRRPSLAERGAEVAIATHGGPFLTVLDAAGVAYDLIGDGVSDERAARFVRSVPGVGPPGQSMWSDDELLAWSAAEADHFGRRGVSVVVTGWTLPALL